MKLVFLAVGGIALAALALGKRNNLVWEVRKKTHLGGFDEHEHSSQAHSHEHSHVTHNRREGPDQFLGEWEHLTSTHAHDHNHPSVRHSHLPHENVDHEHLGEAHLHDHDYPTTSAPRHEA